MLDDNIYNNNIDIIGIVATELSVIEWRYNWYELPDDCSVSAMFTVEHENTTLELSPAVSRK